MNIEKYSYAEVDSWLKSIQVVEAVYEIINDRLHIRSPLHITQNTLPPYALGICTNVRYNGMSLGSTNELPIECNNLSFKNVDTMYHMDFRNSLINTSLDLIQCDSIIHATNINFNLKAKQMIVTECNKLEKISFLNKAQHFENLTITSCDKIRSFDCLDLCHYVENLRISACPLLGFPLHTYSTIFDNILLNCSFLRSFTNIENLKIRNELYATHIQNTKGIINLIFCSAMAVKISLNTLNSYERNSLLGGVLHKYISAISPTCRSDYVMDLCVELVDNSFESEAEL